MFLLPEPIHVIFHYLRTLVLSHRFKTRKALERWQQKKIKKLIAYTRAQSLFYREYWQGHSSTQWQALPIITKTLMMENFSQLNTVGIIKEDAFLIALAAEKDREFSPRLGEFTVGLSSGTSGHRGLFLVSKPERLQWAGTILAKVLPKPLWQKQRIAFFMRANSNLYTSVQSTAIQFQFFDLLDPVNTHIEHLNFFQPTILVAPPSMLNLLGQHFKSKALIIQPKKVISIAEVLEPFEKERLEMQYKQKIHQVYQCTEGFLGATCQYGTLHLNEDLIAVQKEYLDKEKGIFTPIITDFSRYTQPIIRYKLNDILTERLIPCPCGSVFTAIESIDGRCDDLLYFKKENQQGWAPIFPDFIRNAILQAESTLQDYHVTQPDMETLIIGILGVLPHQAEQKIRDTLSQLCAKQLCILPLIHFKPYEQTSITIKKRRIQRGFPAPQEVL